ncbi:methionine--tRNA ligase [Anaerolinea sp.]|uniref:methionine--tRNA ligase n=1 Tax=Anaerolinea sp. TaxID=1872519 RepID=UPI002ACD3214|nr:methionine--tRNA ligase [Anaerolinea sp.]
MSTPVLIAVAWPYANAEIHVGNITGAYLPADIVARYHRLKGNRVLMVSGTDSHGTPVTLRADAEGKPVEEVYKRFHQSFLDLFQKVGLTYDLFTTTHTENHFKVAQSVFLALLKNGYLYTEVRPQWYSPSLGRFLPDRYIEGTCYICGDEHARSDQCDKCGNVLEPEKLINPRSKVDGSTPELRETVHYYLDLSKLEPEVARFLRERQHYWRETVCNQTLGQIESEGLKSRPITRDLDWGIPVPVEGWEGKCLYVWFEAVIGYLSAPIEWARLHGLGDAWKDWWVNPESRTIYFIGKDNIFFHAAWWPAQLLGMGETFMEIFAGEKGQKLVLPYDVPANQFMNLEGDKISGSRNWAVWGHDFLSRYDPDPLRYYLTVNMPEMRDTDWDWEDFYKRNNDELVATWGNLANRVLSFAVKHFEGKVPEPGALTELDEEILRKVESGFESVGAELEAVHLRSALGSAMALATEVNRYLDQTAPWKEIKTDRQAAARAIYTALRCIDNLSVLLSPFLPFSSEKLHQYFGYEKPLFGKQATRMVQDGLGEHTVLLYDPDDAAGKWQPSALQPGQPLHSPQPLFKKLDASIVEEERTRLRAQHKS